MTANRRITCFWALGGLQLFIGIGAVPAGIAMISDPGGESLEMYVDMLRRSPFTDFLIPGIVLLLVNGIGSLFGALVSLRAYQIAGLIAIGLGTFLILWIVIQAWWLGWHLLHVLYILLGVSEFVLGWQAHQILKIKRAVV